MKIRVWMSATMLAVVSGAVSAQAQQNHAPWQNPETWASVAEPQVTSDVIYVANGSHAQRLDVFRNAGTAPSAKAPVLVYMHGGAWNHGEKPASWHGFRPYLAAGFSVVNVEYRLVDEAPAPAAVQDVRCVLSWVARNAASYGFDTQRIVTYGTSAGGHLALLAAVLPEKNDIDAAGCGPVPRVAAVLDFFGPYHLEPEAPGAFKSPSTARWMGPDPKPSLQAMERAMSPSTYLRAGLPPVFIAHGDADPTVPYASSVALHADLDRLGVRNVFDTVPGGKHGGWPPDQQQRVALDALEFLKANGILR